MTKRRRFFSSLYIQVLIAIIIGVALGHFAPETATAMKPLGDGFIHLIKMIIAPIIFCTVVSGIAHMDDMKTAGRIGIKSLFYFEVLTTFAMVIGLVVINVTQPGVGMHIDPATIDTSGVKKYISGGSEKVTDFSGFLLDLIPHTVFSAFAEGNLLQVLLVSIIIAWALLHMGAAGKPILQAVEKAGQLFFRVVALLMHLAPIGAFGAMAFTIGKFGVGSLGNLAFFMATFYLTCILFVLVVLGLLLKLVTGLSIFSLLRFIREEVFIVLGTCSSETVLPRMMEKLQQLGCKKSIVGMVLPTGYSFNLDGTSIYFTMAVVFLAQATDIHLSLWEQLAILGVLLFTSKGAAAVVGTAFVVLAGTLSVTGHIPVTAVAILLGVDRFMAEARAVTNLIGNAVATLIIARWEKSLDISTARNVLSRPS
jgi:aerobic C4-dicarboxylate transport protein